jgi:hypothetical protein
VKRRARAGTVPDDARPTDELLDLGVVGEPETVLDAEEAAGSGALSRRALLTAAGLLVAGVTGVAAWRRPTSRPWTSPASAFPVEVTKLPRPWPGAPGDWDLYGLGDGVLLRVHPASGRVTRTQVPPVGDGQVSLVPVRHRVLVRPVGQGQGFVVPDDARAVAMPPSLAGVGAVLPGPDLDHVWIEVGPRTRQMALVTLDGRRTGAVVPVPEFATTGPMTDGAGGLLFEGVGGLYHVSPAGRLHVSNAILLAVGPGALLTLERDSRGQWHTILRSGDGEARAVPVPIGPQLPHGVLSPDGRTVVLYVVLYVLHEPVSVRLALVDLAAGVPDAQRVHQLSLPVGAGEGTVVWWPDGRGLVSLDDLGRLLLTDATTRAAAPLAPDLPAIRQLAVRTRS